MLHQNFSKTIWNLDTYLDDMSSSSMPAKRLTTAHLDDADLTTAAQVNALVFMKMAYRQIHRACQKRATRPAEVVVGEASTSTAMASAWSKNFRNFGSAGESFTPMHPKTLPPATERARFTSTPAALAQLELERQAHATPQKSHPSRRGARSSTSHTERQSLTSSLATQGLSVS